MRPACVEFDEDFDDGLGQALVHREAFAAPVARRAEALQLVDDGAAAFGFPGPDLFQERFAADLAAAGFLALHHLALDDHLRRDAGVVGARLPEHVLAAHALEAAEDILQRVIEGMPHVERAGHVRRRNDDRVRLGIGAVRTSGFEGVRFFPILADARLDGGRLVGLLKHCYGVLCMGLGRGRTTQVPCLSTSRTGRRAQLQLLRLGFA